MKLNNYPNYKPCHIDWCRLIPDHWTQAQLRVCIDFATNGLSCNQTEQATTTAPVSRIETISEGKFNFEKVGHIERSEADPRRLMRKGDLAFSNINSLSMIGNCAILDSDDEIYAGMNLLHVRPKQTVDPKWLYWLMRSNSFRSDVESNSKPAINQASIPQSKLVSIQIPIPQSKLEQSEISRFLDLETAKIDSLIAEQERLIELLQEKRQAVISHAVTKGLNPNAPMKDSGVEWLGEVPEHWEESRIKRFFRPKKDQGYPNLEVLSVYRDYGVVPKNSRGDNFNKTPDDLSKYQLVEANDLVINKMKCWQGSLGISQLRGITSPDYIVLSSQHDQNSKFFHWLLRCKAYSSIYMAISNGIRPSQWRVESDRFLCLPVFMPPLEEQSSISEHINSQSENLNRLTELAEIQISLLQERRSAIVSAAVTGQIDVRALVVAKEPA